MYARYAYHSTLGTRTRLRVCNFLELDHLLCGRALDSLAQVFAERLKLILIKACCEENLTHRLGLFNMEDLYSDS